MLPSLTKARSGQPITWKMYNDLVERIELLGHVHASGGLTVSTGAMGIQLHGGATGGGGTEIRVAYVKTAPGATTTVACYLDTDATGEEITVNCEICGGTALNSAVPRLADGERIFVVYKNGAWWALALFNASTSC